MEFRGIIDCRIDKNSENDFLTLNLWGKPVFAYVVEEVLKSKEISQVQLLTDSKYIMKLAIDLFGDKVRIVESESECYKNHICKVSGTAAFLKADTLDKCAQVFSGGYMCSSVKVRKCNIPSTINEVSLLGMKIRENVNAFVFYDDCSSKIKYFEMNPVESVVINTKNDFELALVLKKKELNSGVLKNEILKRIKEKTEILQEKAKENGICLIGHSQVDNWNVESISGHSVRNCGIKGISSFEYNEYILKNDFLECNEQDYLLMHGTNDIVYDYTIDEIIKSINLSVDYIYKKVTSPKIYFVACIHVNGRMDRSNRLIDELNEALRKKLKNVIWIDNSELDDEFGNLKQEYTKDGLHLSKEGYKVLTNIVENKIV